MDEPRLRAARPEDLPALCRVYNAARASAGCFVGGDVDLDAFLELVQDEEIWVAPISSGSLGGGRADRIAGFVSVWAADRFVHHLYVAPAHQSRGVGLSLLRHCQACYGLPLSLKCVRANRRACDFYQRHGWTPVEEGRDDDGEWVRLRLG